ncbi:MAG: non-canonical purine NTP pyrophosphatase [Thermoplasmata archaeon]
MTAVTFVSSNPGKSREAAAILRPFGIDVRWRKRILTEPQADDLETVVRAKLNAVRGIPGWVLVEDSGLFIPSLGGFPGVYSSYFEKIWGHATNFRPFFELLRRRDRRATFRTVAGVRRGNRISLFVGKSEGRIAARPQGTQGFGYDPIFIPDGSKRTYAELSAGEKNRLSHRARALRKVGKALGEGPTVTS